MNQERFSEYNEPTSGLGYCRDTIESETSKGNVVNDDIHSTVQRYLQICLQYHENHDNYKKDSPRDYISSSQDFCETAFVQSQSGSLVLSPSDQNTSIDTVSNSLKGSFTDSDPSYHADYNSEFLDETKQKLLRSAMERAQSIAQRLMESSSNNNNTSIYSPTIYNSISPNIFSIKRKEFLIRHDQKLQEFFLKNLQYLVKKDEQSYLNHIQLLEQHNTNHEKIMAQAQKQHMIRPCVAGIGTKIRQKMETKKRKIQSVTPREDIRPICGLYVIGFPSSDSLYIPKERDIGLTNVEDTVRELFGSFGKIQKLTFYQDKQTGLKKGDGLILYDVDSVLSEVKDGNSDSQVTISCFLQRICSQLNGAEMPWGSTLSVEIATSDYKNKKLNVESTQSTEKNGSMTTDIDQHESNWIKDDDNEGDDLDSFFADLEKDK